MHTASASKLSADLTHVGMVAEQVAIFATVWRAEGKALLAFWRGKKNTTAPGPGYYKVKETAIQPFSKSITFNKTKRQETFHSARGPGPGQYENSYRQKGTTGGFKIPKAKRYQASNKNPGPADYRPNQNAVRGKTPTAQIVMDEVDRMVKKMNAHRS